MTAQRAYRIFEFVFSDFLSRLVTHSIAKTAAVNFAALAVTTLTGVLLARGLGQEGRGLYAAVVVWYGIALDLAEVGQGSAVTYFVSRSERSSVAVVRESRRIMIVASFVVMIGGFLSSPWLAGGDHEMMYSYIIVFAWVGFNSLLAPHLYALQGLSISRWNFVRITQPVVNLVAVLVWIAITPLSVIGASICLVVSSVIQMSIALIVFHYTADRGLAVASSTKADLLSYGIRQASSTIPLSLAGNLDRVALSQAGSSAALGQYVVAQSVVGAAGPLGVAIASVVFPRLSAFSGESGARRQMEMRVLVKSSVSMSLAVLLLVAISPWAIPLVFGVEFEGAVELAAWVAPAAVVKSLLVIATTLLRGRGTPGSASFANLIALGVTALSMYLLIPNLGTTGAAAGAFFGSVAGLVVTVFILRRS